MSICFFASLTMSESTALNLRQFCMTSVKSFCMACAERYSPLSILVFMSCTVIHRIGDHFVVLGVFVSRNRFREHSPP